MAWGHARRDVDDREVGPGHAMLGDLAAQHRAKPDDRLPLEDAELLHFHVVEVMAARDPGVRRETKICPK